MVFFLPKIVMQLKSGASYQDVLNKYKGQLTLLEDNNGLCKFSCNVSNSDELLNMLNDMSNSSDMQSIMDWCEPVFYFNLNFFDDPYYPQQYYLKNTGQTGGKSGIDINVEPAWNITKGSANIRIAVVDEGVEAHEDLGTLLPGYTVGGGNGSPQNVDNNDVKAHGEACAGIIAALHNDIGIKGIAPNCKIVPVNIAPYFSTHIDPTIGQATSFASNEDIATALNWAWHNADVLSCSWGGGSPSTYIESAIDSARTFGRNGKGCIVVFASGNAIPFGNVSFPANYNGVIAVGAIDKNGNIWNYSNRGSSLSLVAPSGDVNLNGDVATLDRMGANGYNGGNYMNNFGGTSAACPQVAGIAALLLSVNPDLTETQVKAAMENTATDLGTSGFDNTYGYGLVNAYAAVNKALSISSLTISGPSVICANSTATYTVNNAPSGATVTWSLPAPGDLNLQQNGNTATLTKTNSASRFQLIGEHVILQATITIATTSSSAIVISKNIHVGVPDAQSGQIVFGLTANPTPPSAPYLPFTFNPGLTEDSSITNYYWGYYKKNTGSVNSPIQSAITGIVPLPEFDIPLSELKDGDYTVFVSPYNSCGMSNSVITYDFSIPNPLISALLRASSNSANSNSVSKMFKVGETDTTDVSQTPSVSGIVYPNPVSGILNIPINEAVASQITRTYTIRLYNERGKLLRKTTVKGKSTAQFNVADLPNGVYYLYIYDGIHTKPEIKNIMVRH